MNETWKAQQKKLFALLKKYKYLLLVIAVGLLFLLLPSSGKKETASSAAGSTPFQAQVFELEEVERKFEEILSQVEGAGQVHLVLTVRGGTRQVFARDDRTGEREDSSTTVVLSKGSGVEEVVLLQQLYPQYQGALAVCPGGDDPVVQLRLVEALSALTGLGSDKISICKSN